MSDITLVSARRAMAVSLFALAISLGVAAWVGWKGTGIGGLASGVPSTVQVMSLQPIGSAIDLEVVVRANRDRPGPVEVRIDVSPTGGTLGPGQVAAPGTSAFQTTAIGMTEHPGGTVGISMYFPLRSATAGATTYRIRLTDAAEDTYFDHSITVTFY